MSKKKSSKAKKAYKLQRKELEKLGVQLGKMKTGIQEREEAIKTMQTEILKLGTEAQALRQAATPIEQEMVALKLKMRGFEDKIARKRVHFISGKRDGKTLCGRDRKAFPYKCKKAPYLITCDTCLAYRTSLNIKGLVKKRKKRSKKGKK